MIEVMLAWTPALAELTSMESPPIVMVVCCPTLGIARYLLVEILCCGAVKIVYWPVGWVFLT